MLIRTVTVLNDEMRNSDRAKITGISRDVRFVDANCDGLTRYELGDKKVTETDPTGSERFSKTDAIEPVV